MTEQELLEAVADLAAMANGTGKRTVRVVLRDQWTDAEVATANEALERLGADAAVVVAVSPTATIRYADGRTETLPACMIHPGDAL